MKKETNKIFLFAFIGLILSMIITYYLNENLNFEFSRKILFDNRLDNTLYKGKFNMMIIIIININIIMIIISNLFIFN
jgi:hypothetical protein